MGSFHLKFQKFQKNFEATHLTFSIGNIKSRNISVAYYVVHCYDYKNDELLVGGKPFYTSDRFVVTPIYREYADTFEIDMTMLSKTLYFEIELVLLGITSENPCWFNNIMLEVGEAHTEYHKPHEAFEESTIQFINNNYVVLYSNNGHSLQVVRPNKEPITTKTIPKSECTLLAPHLDEEPLTDTPSKLMMEFINQTEQYIQIKK